MRNITIDQRLLVDNNITIKEALILNSLHFAIKHTLFNSDVTAKAFWVVDFDILAALTPLIRCHQKVFRMAIVSLAEKGCLTMQDPTIWAAQKVAITKKGARFVSDDGKNMITGVAHVETTEVIDYLNEKRKEFLNATRSLMLTRTTEGFISSRLKKYTVQDLKDVIDLKMAQWSNNPQMKNYLTPKTLFNETNFENYIQQVDIAKQNPKQFIDEQQSNINQQQRPDSYTSLSHIYSGLAKQLSSR